MTQQNEPMVKLGGLWEHETRNGDRYLSGSLGAAKLLVFQNSHRDNDNAPTHIVYLAPAPRRDGNSQSNSAGSGQSSNSNRSSSRGSFGSGRGVQRAEPQASDPLGVERFEVRPGELDADGLEVPF